MYELLSVSVQSIDELLNLPLCKRLIELFEFSPLLTRDFSALSTGETRKLLLIRALIAEPDLLILDEPFDGLDSNMQQKLAELITELHTDICMVLVINRWSEIPPFVTHYGLVSQGDYSLLSQQKIR
ncbi:ATP-binding cassette domain-containing protein [Paraglaciecola sp. Hal342]